MRGRFKPKPHASTEFELDLAPLLAVMVKLVPVLLVSAAFVQVMIVESDLPQVVKEAIQKQDDPSNNKKTVVSLEMSRKTGFKIGVEKDGRTTVNSVPLAADGTFDLANLNLALQKIKSENMETFRIEMSPEPGITYKEIVKVMDAARKSKDKSVQFQVIDKKTGKEVLTDFMFPDVVFANMLE